VHALRKIAHIRARWLILVVVHDAAMFEVFELNDLQPFSFLHWTQLEYLKGLQTGGRLDIEAPPEQNDWTERAMMKCASLSRQRSIADLSIGNLKSAIEWAKRSIEVDREDPSGYNLLTQFYLRNGEVDNAKEAARHALDRANLNPISMLRMSQVEMRVNNLPEALVWANRSIETDPKNPWAHSHLAELYARGGNQSAAVRAAAKAAELSPGTIHFAERLVYMRNLTLT
jgi:predicted Zn-dependent protease